MPRAPLLDSQEIEIRLDKLKGWALDANRLVKHLRFKDFGEAIRFVERLVVPADEQNHHPDVAVHWNELTLTLWTHASGGITERDFRLAETIDGMS